MRDAGVRAVYLNTKAGYTRKADADKRTASLASSKSKVMNTGGKCEILGVAAVNYVEKPDYTPEWELGAKVTHVFC